jgi:hypothetical protein
MKKRVESKIKAQDLYGHPVKLNFDKQGDMHKTLIGGVFSLVVNTIMLIYVGLNVKKLLWKELNHNTEVI